ncbi:MAG: hypothetical protein H6937_07145 [Burkholderiales bacterium]|nr:hypothetical protein [Burkholderiales bacterium]
MNPLREIWKQAIPVVVIIIKDGIIVSILWITLWCFKLLTTFLPIDGWAGEYINNFHSFGAIITFSLFFILFVIDVLELHKKGERHKKDENNE